MERLINHGVEDVYLTPNPSRPFYMARYSIMCHIVNGNNKSSKNSSDILVPKSNTCHGLER